MQFACLIAGSGMFLGTHDVVSAPAFVAMCLLVIATPFETRRAMFTVLFQQVTFTELVWLGAVLVWVASHLRARQWPHWRTPITVPWVVWIGVMAVAAVFADLDRANALKATARLVLGGVTAWMIATTVTSATRMVTLLSIAALTGAVVATAAILEAWQVPLVLDALEVFRDGVRLIGGEVRASSTLQYPTITAMYLELVLCGSLGALLWTCERRGGNRVWLGLAIVATLVVGLSLTLTRAAILAALSGVVLTVRWRYQHRGLDRGLGLLVMAGLFLACAPLLAGSAETVRARWTTEGREGWYRATFTAPETISGRPGQVLEVPVTVTNDGRLTWKAKESPPFELSYHWVDARTTRVVQFDGARTPVPSDVEPGRQLSVPMTVRLPREAGQYRLAWDVVQERRLWFGAEPGAVVTFTHASVTGPLLPGAQANPAVSQRAPAVLPLPAEMPGRRTLWRAALDMSADHPWRGVGPDNFRWRYGGYLGQPDADPRVHSNNMFLEVLTGGGVCAAAAFLWFVWRTAGVVGRVRHRLPGSAAAAYSGVAAAATAFLVHGCLDSFLTFTPTLLASGVVLGLLVAPLAWAEAA
jgi:hypothetical protein